MRNHSMVFLALALALALATVVDCNLEGDILHAQKLAWEDPNNVLKSWDPTLVNPCTWYHVTCNKDNFVIRLDLGEAGLSGPILPQLGNLTKLQYLELYGNNLNGAVTEELGQLTNLVSMELQQNVLTGPIPSSIGNIQSLKFLRLNANMLTGEIPIEVLSLIRSGNLSVRNISDNYLKGTIRRSEQTGFSITTVIMDQKTFR